MYWFPWGFCHSEPQVVLFYDLFYWIIEFWLFELLNFDFWRLKVWSFLQAYGLTSVSLVKCVIEAPLMELLTSYEGRYYGVYYIELRDIGQVW